MRIAPPNYTQIPNTFYDDIAKTLKEGELRVLLVIMRQTFGWHKAWDRISLSQLQRKTGMCRDAVSNSLKSLIEKNLVAKRKEGQNGTIRCWYSLVVENQENETDPEDENDDDSEEDSNISYQSSNPTPPSRPRLPTKETITKERELYPPISPKGGVSPRKKIKEEKKERATEVFLTDTQHAEVLKECGGDEKLRDLAYKKLSTWKIGKQISGGKNDFKACCDWAIEEAKKDGCKHRLNSPGSHKKVKTPEDIAKEKELWELEKKEVLERSKQKNIFVEMFEGLRKK